MWFQRLWRTIARFFSWLAGDHQKLQEDADETIAATPFDIQPITAHVDLRFPVFSVEEIARAMNLETQGRERGQQEQPPNDSTALDPVEVGILEEGRKWANRASKEWEEVAELQEVYQLAARIKAQIEKTLEAERIAVSDLKSEAKAPLDQSYLTRDHARDKKSAFEEFRREHSLSRASRYPESGIWNVAVLALIIIIEALFNGTQLATGLSTGLIGGWLQALIFAALNAGIAFLLGWSARFVFHRRVLLKAVGCTLVLIWIVWATGLNFGIAHFRNALAIDRDNASSIALADSMSHPLKVANFYSVLLLTMGLGSPLSHSSMG
jgi:hypothetical protein